MAVSFDGQLERWLFAAGNWLAQQRCSGDELVPFLDQIRSCLGGVPQEPTRSMQNALSPMLKNLVANKILHHPNSDVKVAVASCLHEIVIITAPNLPYEDDQLKEVFQLIVSSFANISDLSSRSYAKRISILEGVSKVRSCVVMLVCEWGTLIVEMFEHFLKGIRDYHPGNVFSSMMTIMTTVLEESDDISQELLSPILASLKVKNDDEKGLPIARILGEIVLVNCAAKVKPYLIQAVQSLRISVDDYSPVVALICEQKMSCVVNRSIAPDLKVEMGIDAKEPMDYHKGIIEERSTWAAVSSRNVPSPSPSESLGARMDDLEAKLVKWKV